MSTESLSAALSEVMRGFANVSTGNGTMPKQSEFVVAIIRAAECPQCVALLTHEGKHESLWFPGGKVEDKDGTPLRAAIRELKEEVGLVLPSEYRLFKMKTLELVHDHEDVLLHVFAADVPLEFLMTHYRTADHVRNLAQERRTCTDDPKPDQLCPVSEIVVEIHDEMTRHETLKPSMSCYSYGLLVTVKELVQALDAPDEDGECVVQKIPLRFGREESPIPAEAEKLYKEPRPIADLHPRAYALNTQTLSLEERQRYKTSAQFMSKLPLISGEKERELYDTFEYLPQLLRTRQIDPESREGVNVTTGCFIGKLGNWFASHQDMDIKTFTELKELVRREFCHRDFKFESLPGLLMAKQNGRLSDYINNFNKHYNYWKASMTLELAGSIFIVGLENADIRYELHKLLKNNEVKAMTQLQSAAVTASVQRSNAQADVGRGKKIEKRSRDGNDNDESADRWRKPIRPIKRGRNGKGDNGGGKGKGNDGSKGDNGGGRGKGFIPQDKYRKMIEIAKSKLTPQQVDDCYKTKACLNCQKTGHKFRDCPLPLPQV